MGGLDKNRRLTLSGEATYRVRGSMVPPVTALVREIGVTELKFVTTEVLAAETILELMIKVSDESDSIAAMGRVVWQGHSSSKFLLDTSVAFVDLDPKTESRLLNYINAAAENIRVNRLHVRCPMVCEVRYAPLSDSSQEKEGVSGDIGVAGMKLFVHEDVEKNTELNMIFDLPHGRGKIAVRGKVVWKGQTVNGMTSIGVFFSGIDQREKQMILRYVNYTLLNDASA